MASSQGKQVEADDLPTIPQVQEEPTVGAAVQHRREKDGGYECEFIHPQPTYSQTECSICLLVLRSPHIASCCSHNFCKECIERVQKAGKRCPLCNKENFILTYNREKDVSLQQTEVYCPHRKMGCEWRGKLEMLDTHLNVNPKLDKQLEGCAFVEVQCFNDGCGLYYQRQCIVEHQCRECPLRVFSCEHCHEYESTYHDVTTNHWPVCKCYPLPCPHECRQETIQRQNLEQHLKEECPLQEVECEFKYTGCEAKLPRKDMPDHLKDNVGHMTLLARQNQMLALQNQALAHQNQELMAKLLEKDEQLRRTMEDSIARLTERQQHDTEELRARLVEKEEQIRELAKQHRREMDGMEEERNKQIKRLSADARQTATEIIGGQDAMIADIKATVDDRLVAIQQKSEADYTKLVRQIGEVERKANSMVQMEHRLTELGASKAKTVEVRRLKDRVEKIERSATTKAEHEKLVQQSVTSRREFNDLIQKQEVTDSSLRKLQGSTAEVATLKNRLGDVARKQEATDSSLKELQGSTAEVATLKNRLGDVARRQEATDSSLRKLQGSTAPAAEVATLKNQLGDVARKQNTVVTTVEQLHHHVHISPVQIVMTKYGQHKQDSDHWISDGFYTHPQGYKICLKVLANGSVRDKGTHVSCYIYLMCGEFDNHLKWPFRGTVTITLLNQREDKNHRTETLPFNDQTPDHITARVTSGERAGTGRGYPQFIPHSQLGYNPATNCQYLVNDCLYFRVKVELL